MSEIVNFKSNIGVLHLISSAAFFGAERVVVELSLYLAKYSDARIVIGVFVQDHRVIENFKAAIGERDIVVVPFDGKKTFSWTEVCQLAKIIDEYQINIVHSHGYKSDIYAFLVKKILRSKIKLIATNHNWIGNSLKERFYQFLDSRVLRSFESVIAVSEKVQKEMIQTGVSSRLIKIIDNGIDIEDKSFLTSKQVARKWLNLSADDFVIGCVARLTQEKAHVDLLTALASVSLSGEDVKLVLVGDGAEKENLECMCQTLRISERVMFVGNRNDARALYAAFDVFALVSTNEGLPMALLEAMALALPVIVSRVGAIPTVIEHDKNGIIVPPSNPSAIVNALFQCKSKPDYAREIGKRARETIINNYSSKKMAQRYEAIYKACVH